MNTEQTNENIYTYMDFVTREFRISEEDVLCLNICSSRGYLMFPKLYLKIIIEKYLRLLNSFTYLLKNFIYLLVMRIENIYCVK